jgi:hypothetical protein
MIALTADDTKLLKDLRMFIEPVEVYDGTGKLLGLFVPADLERGKRIYAEVAAKIDRAEIERRIQSNERGGPLREVLGRIQLLEREMERRKAAGEKEFTIDEAMAYFRSLRAESGQGNHLTEAGVRTETDRCTTR